MRAAGVGKRLGGLDADSENQMHGLEARATKL